MTPPPKITPLIILHGGAGNISPTTIPPPLATLYRQTLLSILHTAHTHLLTPTSTALSTATLAVSLLEDSPLFNAAHGAVFTRAGTTELEASLMLSRGNSRRGVGVMMIQHVKNPIKLAGEILLRGEAEAGVADHCAFQGPFIEGKAKEWGLEMCEPGYYFTQRRWDEHMRGLDAERNGRAEEWARETYVPLGTCGAVVLDAEGTVCVATSTGGLTNKAPGRIGDTPTLGAGFWAEEWVDEVQRERGEGMVYRPQGREATVVDRLSRGDVAALVGDCLPSLGASESSSYAPRTPGERVRDKPQKVRRAVGLSGTGNGDSFLRLAAARTVAARSRFTSSSLADSVSWMAGPGGELQKSADDRWDGVHEGTGGFIGIELVGDKGEVVWDLNCGGMFRAWVDESGEERCAIFKDER